MVDVLLARHHYGKTTRLRHPGDSTLTIIKTAFDPQLIGQLYAAPRFQQDFGYEYEPGKWVIKASWQSGLSMGSPIGQVVGVCLPSEYRTGRPHLLEAGLLRCLSHGMVWQKANLWRLW